MGWLRTRWLYGITDSMDASWRWWRTGKLGMLQSGVAESDRTEQLHNSNNTYKRWINCMKLYLNKLYLKRNWCDPVKGCCCESCAMPGFMTSGGEISIWGQRWGLTTQSFLCNKVLLTYSRDRESFWHRHKKGTENAPLLVFSKAFYVC